MGNVQVGLDVGSTTVKAVVLDASGQRVFSRYVRHGYHVPETVLSVLKELAAAFPKSLASVAMTGAGVLDEASHWKIPFVQELSAEALALSHFAGGVDVSIELGGEDAKVTYFHHGATPDQRMNRSCAGGTGAFLDHLAAFLGTDGKGLDALAGKGTRIYPIAARCGVFAKTDVQALLNEGARKEDIALSVFQAIVNQVISGLARGCPIGGKVALLGGPLTYMPMLRSRFQETLHLENESIWAPEDGALYGALGAALFADGPSLQIEDIVEKMASAPANSVAEGIEPPLFATEAEYQDFENRHAQAAVRRRDFKSYTGPVWLGIDAGSTTMKAVLIDGDGAVLHSWYARNGGDVLTTGKLLLKDVYNALSSSVYIAGSGVTGYGEGILSTAFHIDMGEVETMAHLRAARFFCPDLTALLDIGGQDMKYIRVEDGVISKITLNGSCASGCGSFLETFGETLHMNIQDFAQLAVHAPYLLDLGYHCTVLMNSKVRQVQRNKIDLGALAAGLSMAVVKNALYRVIRLTDPAEMGSRIVVEGGTFYNDAVLRALERVLGREVIRPDMAGLMGAYGMALLAWERMKNSKQSQLISAKEVNRLTVSIMQRRCSGCGNRCLVSAHAFSGGTMFVTGNRCERGELLIRGRHGMDQNVKIENAYHWMRDHLFQRFPVKGKARGRVGIPVVLSMWEDFPYWAAFFHVLGYEVVPSHFDARGMGETAATIPEGIFCEACRLAHVHLWELLQEDLDFIWMPVLPRGSEEPEIDARRHASYGDVLAEAMKEQIQRKGIPLYHPHLPMLGETEMTARLSEVFAEIPRAAIQEAVRAGEMAQISYYTGLRNRTARMLKEAQDSGKTAVILCGREYQTDPQVNKGIPHLLTALGVPVLAGEGALLLGKSGRELLSAGNFAFREQVMASVQLVEKVPALQCIELHSLSCGYDGLTLQEAEKCLRRAGKIHTVLSLDQGMNMGAIRIRIRSLLAEVKELSEHPEMKEHLKALVRTPVDEIHHIFLTAVHPLYDPLLAAAFSGHGVTARMLPKAQLEKAAPFAEVGTGILAVSELADCFEASETADWRYTGSAVYILTSKEDASWVQHILKQISVLYFDCGRRGGNVPITVDRLHRFFGALFLGDFLLRIQLSVKNDTLWLAYEKHWLAQCRDAVHMGTFLAYERTLEEMAEAASSLSFISSNRHIGIEGNPFLYLPSLSVLKSVLFGVGAGILAMGLGEWYANEIGEVYWKSSFKGNRKEAEVCLSARNIAGVYLDAFAKAVGKVSKLDPVDMDRTKRTYLYPRIDEPGKHLPEQQRDLLRRRAVGIIHIGEQEDFSAPVDIGNEILKKRYPDFPYLKLEHFSGENWVNAENRIRMMLDGVR